jgi:hypothetical protein
MTWNLLYFFFQNAALFSSAALVASAIPLNPSPAPFLCSKTFTPLVSFVPLLSTCFNRLEEGV